MWDSIYSKSFSRISSISCYWYENILSSIVSNYFLSPSLSGLWGFYYFRKYSKFSLEWNYPKSNFLKIFLCPSLSRLWYFLNLRNYSKSFSERIILSPVCLKICLCPEGFCSNFRQNKLLYLRSWLRLKMFLINFSKSDLDFVVFDERFTKIFQSVLSKVIKSF